MKHRSFIVLIGVCVISLGYAAYDYWSDKAAEEKKAEQATLLKMNKDQVAEVVLQRQSGDNITLQRTGEGWQIINPITEVADQNSVVDFIEGTTLEKSTDLVKEGDGIDWKLFGLDAPAAQLSFADNAGKKIEFLISGKKNFDGDLYLRRSGENKVFTVSTTWNNRAQKKLLDFRDRRVLKKEPAGFKKLVFEAAGKNLFTVEKEASEWKMSQAAAESSDFKNWILDAPRVNEVIFSLNNCLAQEILVSPQPKDLKDRGLQKAAVKILLTPLTGDPWQVEFFETKSEVYALTSSPARLLRIQTSDFLKYKNQTADALRDRHVAFRFDRDQVAQVQIVRGEFTASFTGIDGKWTVENPTNDFEYKPESVLTLINSIKNLQVLDFKPPTAGVNDPAQPFSLRFLDKNAKLVLELRTLGAYAKEKDSMIKLKSSLLETDFGVEQSRLATLPLEELVHKKVKAP
jgi:hypothetical protein